MDTDDLSGETYHGILVTSEIFHHDLTLQFGILAKYCRNDNEFLEKSETKIKKWLTDYGLDDQIEGIFFDNPPSKENLEMTLRDILSNIEKVKMIPIEQRKFELW